MIAMLIAVPVVVVQDVALVATAHHLTVVATLIATTVAGGLADVAAMTAIVGYVTAAAITIVAAALGNAVLWDQDPIVTPVAHVAIVALDLAHPIDAGNIKI